MRIFALLFSLLIAFIHGNAQPAVKLVAGMRITKSVTVIPGEYFFSSAAFNNPAIIIEGSNITIDFKGAVLKGSKRVDRPDAFTGIAILIAKGSKNITIKNVSAHGFKIGCMADSVSNITIEQSDFSYNYRQHLRSNIFREDVSDWMSYHHNENDEWMRYGAGIYLKNCTQSIIRKNIITNGQCALMMTNCDSNHVYENDFSFNSAIGIGMYRSSENKIYNNRLSFNVRGFSMGVYRRGQDSAGILVFEQCNKNIFAYNLVTHSGDGFFLWAGQTTMDNGSGGCNDNMIFKNDFSFAPTNGIEVTFSSNTIAQNILKECDHGIWGGYSYRTNIIENYFEKNRIGIAIEHGQQNNILGNRFTDDKTGIKLWSRIQQPADWGYAKYRDTKSHHYWFVANDFKNAATAFDIQGTDSIECTANTKQNCISNFIIRERVSHLDTSKEEMAVEVAAAKDDLSQQLHVSVIPQQKIKGGLSAIRVTEWGPYNYSYPLLWLNHIDSAGIYYFDVLAPSGKWEVKNVEGFIIKDKGENVFPSFIKAVAGSSVAERSINLACTGPVFKNIFGENYKNKKPYDFSYKEFDPHAIWQIQFFSWDADHDPKNSYEKFSSLFNSKPFYSITANKLDYTWWGNIRKELPADSFATVATTTINFPAHQYEISVTADDFVKVFIDDTLFIDAWDAANTLLDENTNHSKEIFLEGKHTIKVIHAENAGLATLMFYIKPIT